MRKNVLLLIVLFLSACTLIPMTETDPEKEIEFSSEEETYSETEIYAPATASEPEIKVETGMLYDSNYERLARNVRVKQSDEYGITYEYKDVRIDEIAYMASAYCFKQKGRKAVLHDSQLYRNFSRRATFHCLELQN